jgi:hypothetical protein
MCKKRKKDGSDWNQLVGIGIKANLPESSKLSMDSNAGTIDTFPAIY